MKMLMKCLACNVYTMKKKCPSCDKETSSAHPPKYSFHDKYSSYRRKARFES
ncbi:nucleolar RNA-binding Nop10p family protein [Candidatus Micrarchaeota archaeon]|nr:nucleolar RNA-binding Nop10p family protein [Candidatus Micrarchaeota archaeon]